MKTGVLRGLHCIFLPIEKTGLFLGGGKKGNPSTVKKITFLIHGRKTEY